MNEAARPGTGAAVLGFPENGPYGVEPARVGRTRNVLSQDAYGRGPVQRRITALRGLVRSGNSGGPAVDGDGRVVTTIFAAARKSGSGSGFGVPDSVVRDALEREPRPGVHRPLLALAGQVAMNGGVQLRSLLALAGVLVGLTVATAPASAQKPPNPCLDAAQRAQLRCPDLIMRRPFGLRVDPFVHPGHVMLRAGNSIDSVGAGPAELFGVRSSRMYMKARQRIYRRAKGQRLGVSTGARLYFKYVPGQRSYWKFLHAAQFDLYRLRSNGTRGQRVRRGPKVSYCLRDLEHTRPGKARSPRGRVYPACNTSSRTRKVRLGTSVGWSDVYPPGYPDSTST